MLCYLLTFYDSSASGVQEHGSFFENLSICVTHKKLQVKWQSWQLYWFLKNDKSTICKFQSIWTKFRSFADVHYNEEDEYKRMRVIISYFQTCINSIQGQSNGIGVYSSVRASQKT